MNQELMNRNIEPVGGVSVETQEKVLVGGDLSKLTAGERLSYYRNLCASLGLNPLTKPFEYIYLNDKLTLYARKDCTDQLRGSRDIDIQIISRELIGDVFIVTARAKMNTGRQDESVGAVPLARENGEWKTASSGKRYFVGNGTLARLSPEEQANAMMKAETKAKRRATLSLCGLGMVDETELETMREQRAVSVSDGGAIEDPAWRMANRQAFQRLQDQQCEGAASAAPPGVDVSESGEAGQGTACSQPAAPDAPSHLDADLALAAEDVALQYAAELRRLTGRAALNAYWKTISGDPVLDKAKKQTLYQLYSQLLKE